MSSGRTITIGDIHGCDTAFSLLLEQIEVTESDTLILLGDIIDRGLGSRQCIERILELQQQCRVVHLMGNHEEMMLDALQGGPWADSWLIYGGREFLDSYEGTFESVPASHLDFLRNGKDFYQTDQAIFVHGWLRWNVPVDHETARVLRWERFNPASAPHISQKRVICGHTAQQDGIPAGNEHWLCLDTCAYCPNGYLSALDVESDTLWQASEDGRTREPVSLYSVLSDS